MSPKETAVLILSGGLDSTVLLYDLIKKGYPVKCLTVDYGQRHHKEISSAGRICDMNGIPWDIVDLKGVQKLINNSSQTGDIEVPEGHYEEENMKLTVVPNRNMIMLSIAIGHAINIGAQSVLYAAHAGDHSIYPDCRPGFVMAMQNVAELCDWNSIVVQAPYIYDSKIDIVKRGIELNVPFEKTWTCYKGLIKPCGVCGSCRERKEAFDHWKTDDPLIVKGWDWGPISD